MPARRGFCFPSTTTKSSISDAWVRTARSLAVGLTHVTVALLVP